MFSAIVETGESGDVIQSELTDNLLEGAMNATVDLMPLKTLTN